MRIQTKLTTCKNNLLKYGGIALLVSAFFLFIGVLIFSSAFSLLSFEKCVAVVDIDNEITTQTIPATIFSPGLVGSEEMAKSIREINERDDIGAVVFVINSPGGSVVATREIYFAIKELKKPKVAYFREIATSGAYYLSSGADYIISEPNALTGSIGVIITLGDMSELFEKVGINITTIKSGEHKDIGSFSRKITKKEEQILQTLVDEIFLEFKSIILENRGALLNKQTFEEILDGRVLSGRQAEKIGLVDELGEKRDAIKKAALLANISSEKPKICEVASLSKSSGGLFDMRSVLSVLFPKNTKTSVKYE